MWIASNAHAQTRLTIATDDWPPYEFVEPNSPGKAVTGFSTEVVRAVLKKMQAEIAGDIQLYPFARLERSVLEGTVDAIYSIAVNDKREACCYFPSESIIDSVWVLYIRKEDEGRLKFASYDDLQGKSIGVVRGYTYSPEFWRFLETHKGLVDEANSDEMNFRRLMLQRIDYVAADLGNASALLKKMALSEKLVPLMNNPIRVTGLHIIFNKKNVSKKFVDDFSMHLKAFKASAEYKEIHKKYF